ncbi:hypothetical protein TUM1881_01240 [Escherichia coli]|nr:hypothetical protein TUM1881_01240 [Escherichia coli]
MGGHIWQQGAHRVSQVTLGFAEVVINPGADAGGKGRTKAAGLFHLRQLDTQTADVRQHLHPDIGVRRAASDA